MTNMGNEMKMKAFGVGRVLGTGAFSTVRLVTHRASGRTYALKLVDKQKSSASSIAREVGLMRRGGAHVHLVSLFDHFELARAWVLVLELVSGGEVFDRICSRGAYSERDAAVHQGRRRGGLRCDALLRLVLRLRARLRVVHVR